MFQLPIGLLILGVLFYLDEWSSEKPSLVRAAVFGAAVIESALAMALRA